MPLKNIIIECKSYDEFLVVYAKQINGKFSPNSEIEILELTEDELEMDTNVVADLKCPQYTYFLEIFLIQECLNDLKEILALAAGNDPLVECETRAAGVAIEKFVR
jgi:hypothetical protein